MRILFLITVVILGCKENKGQNSQTINFIDSIENSELTINSDTIFFPQLNSTSTGPRKPYLLIRYYSFPSSKELVKVTYGNFDESEPAFIAYYHQTNVIKTIFGAALTDSLRSQKIYYFTQADNKINTATLSKNTATMRNDKEMRLYCLMLAKGHHDNFEKKFK